VEWPSPRQTRTKRGKQDAASDESIEEEEEEEEEEDEAYSSDDSTAHAAKRRKQRKQGTAGDTAFQVTVKDGRPATSGYKGVTR
jgi:hypothetical protein